MFFILIIILIKRRLLESYKYQLLLVDRYVDNTIFPDFDQSCYNLTMNPDFASYFLIKNTNLVVSVFIGLTMLFFIVISAVLVYHWRRYGIHTNTVKIVTTVYFVVSAILLISIIKTAISLI